MMFSLTVDAAFLEFSLTNIVRINGTKAIYYNNKTIKLHLFNASEK
jgi:hypothetical protein